MPRREWKLRIRHILDAINKIRVYTAGMSLAALYPQIPWRLMQDMRNVVVHDYPNVSLQADEVIQSAMMPEVFYCMVHKHRSLSCSRAAGSL